MTTFRSPSALVAGHRDCAAALAPILAETSQIDCMPPLRAIASDELEMAGVGPAMTRLRMQVQRIGPHFRTVVISGEAGTGKELVARALHRRSPGAAGPFVHYRIRKPSEGGSDRSMTAASFADIDSMVTMAQGGTLFFDRMGEMPLQAQTQLLRALRRQDGSQNGLAASRKVDLRMIASTREDLKVLASAGQFLQELYQRLAMVEIALPPLRERREDIPYLAMLLFDRFVLQFEKDVRQVGESAMKRLEAHLWPGNVRELESVLRQSILQCEGTVLEADDLPQLEETNNKEEPTMVDALGTARLQDVVEQHVLRVLKSCAGNKLRAAEILGISRSTLYRMLEARAYADGATTLSRSLREVKEERYTR
jgi:DNA-binding NtrC family response regulator